MCPDLIYILLKWSPIYNLQLDHCALSKSSMANLVFGLEWSYYSLHSRFHNIPTLLASRPSSLFQLSLWTEALIAARADQLDVPDSAVFYLSGRKYEQIISHLAESEKVGILSKLTIAAYIFKIRSSERLARELEEVVMTACALHSLDHPEAQLIKTKAITNYLKVQGCFLKENCAQKVANYLSAQVRPTRQLKQMGDVFLGTLIVQQLAAKASVIETVKKFIVFYKKQSVLFRILEHITRHFDIHVANMAIELAENFGQLSQMLRVLDNNPEPFYRSHEVMYNNHKESEFKHFSNFMIGYTSARSNVLYGALFDLSLGPKVEEFNVPHLIATQSRSIFKCISKNPMQTVRKCIQSYLQLSSFAIPNATSEESLSNPLSVVSIIRKYWEHEFHRQVISCCIWVLLDHKLGQLSATKMPNHKNEEIKIYRRYIFEALLYVSFSYRAGSFVTYYPVEYSRLQQMFTLEHLPAILVTNPQNMERLTWLQLYFRSELPRILKLEDGYNLLWSAASLKLINIKNYGSLVIQILESDLSNSHAILVVLNSKEWACKILGLLSRVENCRESCQKLVQKIDAIDASMRAVLS